jgi:hypothetical protein
MEVNTLMQGNELLADKNRLEFCLESIDLLRHAGAYNPLNAHSAFCLAADLLNKHSPIAYAAAVQGLYYSIYDQIDLIKAKFDEL